MTKPAPVHIITGFLGSGKTTFLNHFIKNRLPERIFVIENECGDTNIDGGLVMEGVEEVVELSSGCLCCSLADGLLDILEEASRRRDEYDRIVIETTGIADPSSIIQVFLENPAVERFFNLQQVICLADAELLPEWLDEAEEALRQVAMADSVLINKADKVNPNTLSSVKELVRGINPHALVLTGWNGVFPVKEIIDIGTVKANTVETKRVSETHHHEHGNNDHRITTFTITFPAPLDLDELSLDLNRIVNLYRDQVYRVKGFIAIPEYPNRVLLQSARSTFIASDGSPWETEDNREGKLVFIGRNLKREVFEKMFNRYLVETS